MEKQCFSCACALTISLNEHVKKSSLVSSFYTCMNLCLLTYLECAISECADGTARMRRPVFAFADPLCDYGKILVNLLNMINGSDPSTSDANWLDNYILTASWHNKLFCCTRTAIVLNRLHVSIYCTVLIVIYKSKPQISQKKF